MDINLTLLKHEIENKVPKQRKEHKPRKYDDSESNTWLSKYVF